MNAAHAIEIACKLSCGLSGWQRYIRVNDYVVDTAELMVVAMAWPRMERGAFPIRKRSHDVADAFNAGDRT